MAGLAQASGPTVVTNRKRALTMGLGVKTDTEIARGLGISRERVRQFRVAAGVPRRPVDPRFHERDVAVRTLLSEGLCVSEASRRLGLSIGITSTIRKRLGLVAGHIGDQTHRLNLDAWFRGVDWEKSNKQIAYEAGHSVSVVSVYRYRIRAGTLRSVPPCPPSPYPERGGPREFCKRGHRRRPLQSGVWYCPTCTSRRGRAASRR